MARVERRDRNKETFWRRILRRQGRSGLSVRAWCRQHGQRESAFYWWRRELARRDAARGDQRPGRRKPSFVPVRMALPSRRAGTESSGPDGRIEILLSGDRRIRVSGRVDRQMLADVLAALNGCEDRAGSGSRPEARPC